MWNRVFLARAGRALAFCVLTRDPSPFSDHDKHGKNAGLDRVGLHDTWPH